MSFPRTDADLLARIAVLEFVLDQGDGQENSVTLEERYYAPPSVCCENAKTTSGILSALTAWREWILSFTQDGKRAGAQPGAFTLLRAVIKYAYEQGIRSKCLTEKN